MLFMGFLQFLHKPLKLPPSGDVPPQNIFYQMLLLSVGFFPFSLGLPIVF